MNKCYLLLTVCFGGLLIGGLTSCSPLGDIKQAELYDQHAQYYDAVQIYKSLYQSSKKDRKKKADLANRVGEDLRKNKDYRQSEGWYSRAVSLGYKDPVIYQHYADVLKMDEKYDEAVAQLEIYKKEMPSDTTSASEQIAVIKDFLNEKQTCQLYFVDNFRIANSAQNDFAPVLVKSEGGMVFTSDRTEATGKKTFGRTGLKYTDIFVLTKKKSGKVMKWAGPPTPLEGDVNTDKNQGTATFDGKGTTMYYTDCNGPFVIDVKKKNDAKNVDAKKHMPNCVIKVAVKKGKAWGDPQILPFCTDTSLNYGQPAISPDGQRLVFSMNGPNTRGGHDLYLSTFVKRGRTWSDPVNLGDNVNTKGEELYPSFFNDTTLYFSSDGWPGLGGLDLFMTHGQGDTWSKPKHLKAPINSGGDDFGITFDEDKVSGYFSSDRVKSKMDDIYSFTIPPQTYTLSGVVYFNDTIGKRKRPQPGAEVTLTSQDGRKFKAKTNKDGFYKFTLADNTNYKIIAKKHGYFSSNLAHATTVGLECSKDMNQDLEVTLPIINIHNIYYEVDSSRLLPASRVTLDSLYDHVLAIYPYMVFEVGSHTDCRASYHHNDSLSLRRAQVVVEYLVSKGVDKGRLVPHGYGEHELVNNCACEPNNVGPGATCTDAEHAANRRTTFKIKETNFQNKTEKEKEDEESK